MQGTPQPTGQGMPSTLILVPFMDIPSDCMCSWIWDASNIKNKVKRLKYEHTQCPARFWHQSTHGMATIVRRPAANGRRYG